MKDLRALLIDCRIELRKYQRDFQKSQLCERLDLMLQAVTSAEVTKPATAPNGSPFASRAAPAPAAAPEKTQTASQVALAWQTAARDLKFTDPAIYQQLSDKVMRLLGSKSLVDPTTEILQLQAEVDAQAQRAQAAAETLREAELDRNSLLAALADAVPDLTGGSDPLGAGLAQIAQLVARGPSQATGSSSHAGRDSAPRAPTEPNIPTPDILKAVAGGIRKFSDDQRNWGVGEGMVLSGFQYTPVELIDMGDQGLAQLILEKQG